MPLTTWYGFLFLLRLYTVGGQFNLSWKMECNCLGFVHKDWIEAGVDLKVTAMDLKSAYKQLPLRFRQSCHFLFGAKSTRM